MKEFAPVIVFTVLTVTSVVGVSFLAWFIWANIKNNRMKAEKEVKHYRLF